MQFGVNTYIWGATFGPADFHLLPKIKASGFDGIEVPILDPATFRPTPSAASSIAIGLARTAVANVPGGSSLASSDGAARQRAIDHVTGCIKAARDLGARLLAGPMYTPVGLPDRPAAHGRGVGVGGRQLAAPGAGRRSGRHRDRDRAAEPVRDLFPQHRRRRARSCARSRQPAHRDPARYVPRQHRGEVDRRGAAARRRRT